MLKSGKNNTILLLPVLMCTGKNVHVLAKNAFLKSAVCKAIQELSILSHTHTHSLSLRWQSWGCVCRHFNSPLWDNSQSCGEVPATSGELLRTIMATSTHQEPPGTGSSLSLSLLSLEKSEYCLWGCDSWSTMVFYHLWVIKQCLSTETTLERTPHIPCLS